jgi:hypothetical protein
VAVVETPAVAVRSPGITRLGDRADLPFRCGEMIWLVLWIAVTIYGLVGLSLILRHGLRALWELWPPGPEPKDALKRRPATADRPAPPSLRWRSHC